MRARQRAQKLGLYGLLSDWDAVADQPWVEPLLAPARRPSATSAASSAASTPAARPLQSHGRLRLHLAQEDRPRADRRSLLLRLARQATNVILLGPNGVGKTMIAQNLAHQAVLRGVTALLHHRQRDAQRPRRPGRHLLATAPAAPLRPPHALGRRRVGYLSYDNRHADLLFEVVTRRYGQQSTLITTNKPFAEWNEVFPNAACVVTLVDRLVHHAEIVNIDGESYRLKEAREEAAKRPRSAPHADATDRDPHHLAAQDLLRRRGPPALLPAARHPRPAPSSRPPAGRRAQTDPVPLDLIRAAFLLGAARRVFSPSAPLPVIRSLHYFLPILEELSSSHSLPVTWQHLRQRLGLTISAAAFQQRR